MCLRCPVCGEIIRCKEIRGEHVERYFAVIIPTHNGRQFLLNMEEWGWGPSFGTVVWATIHDRCVMTSRVAASKACVIIMSTPPPRVALCCKHVARCVFCDGGSPDSHVYAATPNCWPYHAHERCWRDKHFFTRLAPIIAFPECNCDRP
jgi:hypothetical protein